MSNFELVCIYKADANKQIQNKINENVEKSINDKGGKVIDKEIWGLKDLSYPINKSKKGFYILFQIDIDSKELSKLNSNLNLEENIIRHMAVKVDKHEKLPTIMAEQKAN
tara:strand:+ start:564 stop:893 length:330 start_codon:yes stop_codon:yes gene_type:complete